jgi:hypothetical protein
MPIYEFVCQSCNRESEFPGNGCFPPFANQNAHPAAMPTYLVSLSGFAYHKSTATVWEESGEPAQCAPVTTTTKTLGTSAAGWRRSSRIWDRSCHPNSSEQIQAAREGVLPEPLKDLESASPTAAYD